MFLCVMANVDDNRRIDHTYLRDVGGTYFLIKILNNKNSSDT